jgi:hypothetical protein
MNKVNIIVLESDFLDFEKVAKEHGNTTLELFTQVTREIKDKHFYVDIKRFNCYNCEKSFIKNVENQVNMICCSNIDCDCKAEYFKASLCPECLKLHKRGVI